MPATMEDSVIKIGTNTYKKRNVVAQLVEVGQFQELRLIYKSQVIYVCSDDPGSVNYQNSIFGQTEPQKILKASTGNIQVMGELSLILNEVSQSKTESSVKVVTQVNHGFTQPCIAYIDAQEKYHPADRSDTAKIGTILILRIIDVNTFEVAIASRVYNIAVTNPVPNKTVYLSATPGGLTCDPPGVSETIVRLGELQESNQFYWNPDKRQGVGQ